MADAPADFRTIRFDDVDTITTSCLAFMEGREMPEHPTTLKRVK